MYKVLRLSGFLIAKKFIKLGALFIRGVICPNLIASFFECIHI